MGITFNPDKLRVSKHRANFISAVSEFKISLTFFFSLNYSRLIFFFFKLKSCFTLFYIYAFDPVTCLPQPHCHVVGVQEYISEKKAVNCWRLN